MSHHGKHEHGQPAPQLGQHPSQEALAYHLWEQAGRPEGQASHFWKLAEEQLKRAQHPTPASQSDRQ